MYFFFFYLLVIVVSCHVRDFLCDVINAQPIVVKYLLCFTKDVVTEYAAQPTNNTTISWMSVEADSMRFARKPYKDYKKKKARISNRSRIHSIISS